MRTPELLMQNCAFEEWGKCARACLQLEGGWGGVDPKAWRGGARREERRATVSLFSSPSLLAFPPPPLPPRQRRAGARSPLFSRRSRVESRGTALGVDCFRNCLDAFRGVRGAESSVRLLLRKGVGCACQILNQQRSCKRKSFFSRNGPPLTCLAGTLFDPSKSSKNANSG